MDTDDIVDDEFQSRQTHPIIGDEGEMESIIRIPHIHHNPGVGLLQMFHVESFHFIVEDPLID